MKKLLDFFQRPEEIWKASPDSLRESDLPPAQIESFMGYREKYPDAPEKMFEYCRTHEIHLITIRDESYPNSLRQIKNPPTLLFYYGQLEPTAKRIAMVGTRRVTIYGRRVASELSEFLACAGFTIVSGAAAGIDTSSHWGALRYGRTVAVLGCGIDSVYPKENRELLRKIAERGAVISEYSPFTPPSAGYFPARNRIISGLSRGTIVVEASEKSGAIITADLAKEQGRDVFVIPGDVDAESMRGCHRLAQRGAILIAKPQDVLDFYNGNLKLEGNVKISRRVNQPRVLQDSKDSQEILKLLGTESNPEPKFESAESISEIEPIPEVISVSEDEQKILDAISDEPLVAEEIVERTGIGIGKIFSILLGMENRGLIRKNDLDRYIKIGNPKPPLTTSIKLSDEEQKILDAISNESLVAEEIVERTGIMKIFAILLGMESKNLIRKDDLDRYSRV